MRKADREKLLSETQELEELDTKYGEELLRNGYQKTRIDILEKQIEEKDRKIAKMLSELESPDEYGDTPKTCTWKGCPTCKTIKQLRALIQKPEPKLPIPKEISGLAKVKLPIVSFSSKKKPELILSCNTGKCLYCKRKIKEGNCCVRCHRRILKANKAIKILEKSEQEYLEGKPPTLEDIQEARGYLVREKKKVK